MKEIMKKILFVLALLTINASSYSSQPDSNKTKKVLCAVSLPFVAATIMAGPGALSSAFSVWAQACAKPKGSGSSTIVFKKDF